MENIGIVENIKHDSLKLEKENRRILLKLFEFIFVVYLQKSQLWILTHTVGVNHVEPCVAFIK